MLKQYVDKELPVILIIILIHSKIHVTFQLKIVFLYLFTDLCRQKTALTFKYFAYSSATSILSENANFSLLQSSYVNRDFFISYYPNVKGKWGEGYLWDCLEWQRQVLFQSEKQPSAMKIYKRDNRVNAWKTGYC